MEDNELADYFNEASEARQSEDQVSPGISAAHEYDPDGLDGTSLGDAPLATPEFNQAANDPEDREYEAEQTEQEHAPTPELEPRPSPDFAPGVDRSADNQQQANLHQAEMEKFLDQAYDDLEVGQDGGENDNVKDDKENGGLDDGMDQN